MSVQSLVRNELVADASSVWVLKEHREFGYSDGRESERYLERVFRSAKDLSYRSTELESYIKDWASEYHLTTKRAQLLSGFTFDRSARVLEVGCGCGAITRFLGETFDQVVSVEGSIHRARLARLRTRDLSGVSIICAPFQEIDFQQKFDIIFCIGVYEYSGSFVGGEDPYDAVLQYFKKLLTPNGTVVIAIENQFGLKYFSSAREDHLGVMFAGLEGYRAHDKKVRTFGKSELEQRLLPHFPSVEFYYPYPDYKLPDCVLSHEFLQTREAGELVSQMKSRDYGGQFHSLFDEALVSLELSRNSMLPFFANSFVVMAGQRPTQQARFDQLAILYSAPERKRFRTRTRVVRESGGQLAVIKQCTFGKGSVQSGPLTLVDTRSDWQSRYSLHTLVYLNAQKRNASLAAIFAPCRPWVSYLQSLAVDEGGRKVLGGEYVDCILSNVYPSEGGCKFVDREWKWSNAVGLNAVAIRALYRFVASVDTVMKGHRELDVSNGRRLISNIGRRLGLDFNDGDFDEFVALEARFQSLAYGVSEGETARAVQWFLRSRNALRAMRRARKMSLRVRLAIQSRLRRYVAVSS